MNQIICPRVGGFSLAFQSCFSRTFDVIIFGTGYAAFGAALQLKEQKKSICIVSRQSDLLWESGRAYMPHSGSSNHPLWTSWLAELKNRHAATDTETDGALAEVIATELIAHKNITLLYYTTPVAIEPNGDSLESIMIATKSGYHRLVAKQWIDTTEAGEIAQLINPNIKPRIPSKRHIFAYYQSLQWPNQESLYQATDHATLTWSPTLWPRQRRLTITQPGEIETPRKKIIPCLQAFYKEHSQCIENAPMSHCSLIDYPEYTQSDPITLSLPNNVIAAAPALSNQTIRTLSDRFTLGVETAQRLTHTYSHTPSDDIHTRPTEPTAQNTLHTEVLIAGAGTGGAYAAISAARAGAKVTTIEPYEFPGGIGAGGGIHWYYYGVPGCLQAEAD